MAVKKITRTAPAVLMGIFVLFFQLAGCASTETEGDFSVDLAADETVDFVSDTDDEEGEETPECDSDMDCNDGIACTVDHCEDGECVNDPCEDCCPDDLTCIPDYGCGTAPKPCTTDEECKDDIACTLDRCRDETFCENIPQNGLCDDDEICLAALGCIPKPPDECEEDEDCDMANPCLGEWYCDPEFGCQFLSVLDCSDEDICTDDQCDPETGDCIYPIKDADDDGYGDIDCEGGDDCDDDDPDVYPGAPELCNEKDDDCDEIIDEGCCDEGAECETECGTTGTIDCPPDGGEGECVPPDEVCNGDDDDCDTLVDEDFECTPPESTEDCETECESTGTRECSDECSWGECEPPDEVCNGLDDDCIEGADNGFACVLGSFRDCTTTCSSTGTRECIGGCVWDTCVPPDEICNGVDDDCDTLCDNGDAFNCCAGATIDCRLLDFYDGTAVCTPDCMDWNISGCTNCGNGEIDEGEQCDDEDFGDDDCTTLGMGFTGGDLECDSACRFDTSNCYTCGDGNKDPDEECDGSDFGDPAVECKDVPPFTGGELDCTDDCELDTSACWACGDGHKDPGEECDPPDYGDPAATCGDAGDFTGGELGCTGDCTFDTSECTNCGDGNKDPGEECDGSDFGDPAVECEDIDPFTGGVLDCTGECTYDTSDCWQCGDGEKNPGEECDPPDYGDPAATCDDAGFCSGDIGCHENCSLDTQGCTDLNRSGDYATSIPISYACACFFSCYVEFSITVFTFNDTCFTLSVDDNILPGTSPCVMVGSINRGDDTFVAECTKPGDCDEIYRLEGQFISPTQWTGTFSATFIGGFNCVDCTYQEWTITGTLM